MITLLLWFLGGVVAALAVLGAAFLTALWWTGSGSPDVNGGPERDGGLSDTEIAATWSRTADPSEATISARPTDRASLRTAAGH